MPFLLTLWMPFFTVFAWGNRRTFLKFSWNSSEKRVPNFLKISEKLSECSFDGKIKEKAINRKFPKSFWKFNRFFEEGLMGVGQSLIVNNNEIT